MPDKTGNPLTFRLLRLVLILGAIGAGSPIVGVFLPWPVVADLLKQLGAQSVPTEPMFQYWGRMVCGSSAFIGAIFLLAAVRPARYAALVPLLGVLTLGLGVVLLTYGLLLGLPCLPFYADVAFCFAVGLGLLVLRRAASAEG
jgi:hypothetical protein